MKAIPTIYRGRQYRSRLEARWAAFFDLVGWKVEYEPIDFNGWIPDFVICEATTVYVEVKPVYEFPKDVAEKIEQSGCKDEALILGATCPIKNGHSDTSFGWLSQVFEDDQQIERDWSDAVLSIWEGHNGNSLMSSNSSISADGKLSHWKGHNPQKRIGFCHSVQSFYDRVTGLYDGGCFGEIGVSIEEVKRLWNEAGNTVQWSRNSD